jgi:hypothetical protein
MSIKISRNKTHLMRMKKNKSQKFCGTNLLLNRLTIKFVK